MSDTATKFSAWSALVLSAAAVTMSGWVAVGCHGGDDAAVREEARPAATTVSASGGEAPRSNDTAPARTGEAAGASAEQPSSGAKGVQPSGGSGERAEKPESAESAAPEDLQIKRLVVTSGIDDREPMKVEQLQAGSGPIYAFVELENRSEADGAVVVTFERGSRRVGNVQLKVPAKQPRWRTWGRTSLIASGGTWDAVVRSADGHELARKSFEVSAPAKAAKSAEKPSEPAKADTDAKVAEKPASK